MRSTKDKELLVSRFTDVIYVDEFLRPEEITYLIDLFDKSNDKIYKNTGPVTSGSIMKDPLIEVIAERLQPIIGDFKIYSAAFFNVKFPHIIHNDDEKSLPKTYKAITLPLKIERSIESTELPKLCVFDQYYLEGPGKFFNGDKDIPTYYNTQIYEYSNVQNKSSTAISQDTVKKYLTHLKPSWLKDLSLNSMHEWQPGSAIIFDALKLHCASDFRQQHITSKLGISIFTYTD
jgi:hypothetical protein